MDAVRIAAALVSFIEADTATNRDKYVAGKSAPLQRKIAAIFRQQGQRFIRGFSRFKEQFPTQESLVREAFESSDWLPLWQATAAATAAEFGASLETAVLEALIFGGGQLIDSLQAGDLDFSVSWNLENPRAVAYAKMHAAAQVTLIDEATRAGLNGMITHAADEGWSYTRLSDAIGERFTEFATGGENPRSRRIAVFELGDAYEAGNEMAARGLMDAGLELQKKWLSVGDDRVRPSHRENQGAGWIDYNDTYPSGDFRPPTDPGCRCTTLTRRKRAA